MKFLLVLLTFVIAVHANSVFLGHEEASQILNRHKRANFGWEEVKEGDLQRECYDEQCNYEEVHEVFEEDTQTEQFWQTLTNQCRSEPCDGPGTNSCVNIYNGHVCLCKPGFTGRECEHEINYCVDEPCMHGVCLNDPPTYRCACEPGYTGQNCDEDKNECELFSDLCKNDGYCENLDGSYQCNCKPGWMGRDCSQDVNECVEKDPCEHGMCVNERGSFRCDCKPGYAGYFCSLDVDECLFGYCPEGSTCVDEINKFTCLCPRDGCGPDLSQIQQNNRN